MLPGSDDYSDNSVFTHLAQLDGQLFNNVNKYIGHSFFEVYGLELPGVITKENFVKDFVRLVVIETRRKNLDAFMEGLTLNGMFFLSFGFCLSFWFST